MGRKEDFEAVTGKKPTDEEVLEAVRVTWAWAMKHEEAAIPEPTFHRYMSKVSGDMLPQWRIAIPDESGAIRVTAFDNPKSALVALAKAMVAQDPKLSILQQVWL
jgi:hypothetical protein